MLNQCLFLEVQSEEWKINNDLPELKASNQTTNFHFIFQCGQVGPVVKASIDYIK
jgi:hypothetical protein